MSSEDQATTEHLELSVDETNKLRTKLGLAPLRGVGISNSSSSSYGTSAAGVTASGREHQQGSNSRNIVASSAERKKEDDDDAAAILELSVQETNALRAQLGLAPLRTTKNDIINDDSTTTGSIVHKPAINLGAESEAAARIERARLQRQVQQGVTKTFGVATLADDPEANDSTGGALSWAQQMRARQKETTAADAAAVAEANKKSSKNDQQKKQYYSEEDLSGMNVAHSLGELQDGATTILTMADTEILDEEDNNIQLENVNLAEQRKQHDGLREKRKVEMGLGRAGGYAGFDDDEFEELGGTQGPARFARGTGAAGTNNGDNRKSKNKRGFQIGAMLQERDDEERQESDLFAAQAGKPISLDSSTAAGVESSIASDFMTAEEEQAQLEQELVLQRNSSSKKKDKKRNKDAQFKKDKKKKKKDKKKNKRHLESDDEEEEETKKPPAAASTKSLLDELEETAVADDSGHVVRKRKRSNDAAQEGDHDDDDDETMQDANAMDTMEEKKQMINQRARYDAIMAKGNQRTRAAFQPAATTTARGRAGGDDDDEEPDDAFLNAAISKARRLNRLKAMSAASHARGGAATSTTGAGGADEAIVASLQQQKQTHPDAVMSGGGGKTVIFSVDDTREFTRSLQARAEQAERDQARKAAKKEKNVIQALTKSSIKTEDAATTITTNIDEGGKAQGDEEETNMGIEELAKHVKVDEDASSSSHAGMLDGAIGAASSKPLGRGMGNVLGMLKQTGEITRKNAGKEEQRGRARDEHLDNEVDLSEVVKIDDRTATDKDKEMARRAIKLEYRDKHGRLLTPKEAYRDLSYHFHGYGSGKRKEEKKLQQIAREQAAARMASQQEGGSFGALKATQKATGKAFVVHKT